MERPDWFLEDQYPFESHWHEIDGAQVHYLDEGDGRPLLMLHGNPTWSFLYRRMVPFLSDRFRCIALDYPGFGLSKAPAGYGFTPGRARRGGGQVHRRPRSSGLHPGDAGLGWSDRAGSFARPH